MVAGVAHWILHRVDGVEDSTHVATSLLVAWREEAVLGVSCHWNSLSIVEVGAWAIGAAVVIYSVQGTHRRAATLLAMARNKILELVRLALRHIDGLMLLVIEHLLWMHVLVHASWVAEESIGRHHACAAECAHASTVAVPLVALSVRYCRGGHPTGHRRGVSVIADAVVSAWPRRQGTNRVQLGYVVTAGLVGAGVGVLRHHLLVLLHLATCAPSHVVLSLVIINGSIILWACDASGAISGSGEASSLPLVSLVRGGVCLRM